MYEHITRIMCLISQKLTSAPHEEVVTPADDWVEIVPHCKNGNSKLTRYLNTKRTEYHVSLLHLQCFQIYDTLEMRVYQIFFYVNFIHLLFRAELKKVLNSSTTNDFKSTIQWITNMSNTLLHQRHKLNFIHLLFTAELKKVLNSSTTNSTVAPPTLSNFWIFPTSIRRVLFQKFTMDHKYIFLKKTYHNQCFIYHTKE